MARAHRRPIARFKGDLLPGEHLIEGARPEEVIRIEEILGAAGVEVAIAFLVMDPGDLPDHALLPPRLAAIGVGVAFALVAHMMLGAHRSCSRAPSWSTALEVPVLSEELFIASSGAPPAGACSSTARTASSSSAHWRIALMLRSECR